MWPLLMVPGGHAKPWVAGARRSGTQSGRRWLNLELHITLNLLPPLSRQPIRRPRTRWGRRWPPRRGPTLVYPGLPWSTLVYAGLRWSTLVYAGLPWSTLVARIAIFGISFFCGGVKFGCDRSGSFAATILANKKGGKILAGCTDPPPDTTAHACACPYGAMAQQ